jgi:CubicO group peptidase (beta-lactamase class C family)
VRSALCTLFTLLVITLPPVVALADDIPPTIMKGPAAETMHRYLDALVPLGFHGTALVAQRGEVVFHRAYGVADPRTGRPNTTGTMFSTGSVTKQFTATAIMKLASQGRLSVDDPLSRFIDGVPLDKEAITLHHLLTHTAGLRPAYGDDLEVVARDDLVRRILETPLMNGVGETYEYSNAGYTLLAVVVEEVTGMPYEKYLRETFYEPLDMTRTGLTSLDIAPDRVARAHAADQGFPSPAERPAGAWNLYGNGGQLSTTADMYRWVRALREDRLLPHEYTEKMFTRYVREDPDGRCHYGYGWSICDTRRGGDLVWHNGGATGLWSCAVYQYIDDDAVFIVFTNSTIGGRSPVDPLCVNLSRILFGEAVDMPPVLAHNAHIDSALVAGTWELEGGGSITITPAENGVRVTPLDAVAMTAVFPSPMSDMLARYNDMTREMINAMRRGEFDSAGAMVDMEPGADQTGAEWLRAWWDSIDDVASLERIEILGTMFADGSQTYARLHTGGATHDVCVYWMMGRCVGLAPVEGAPSRHLAATTSGGFVAFSMDGGVLLEFAHDGRAQLQSAGRVLTCRRRDR